MLDLRVHSQQQNSLYFEIAMYINYVNILKKLDTLIF